MALQPHELKALALKLSAALPPAPARKVELVVSTGEAFDSEALDMARAYMKANGLQRRALRAVAESFAP